MEIHSLNPLNIGTASKTFLKNARLKDGDLGMLFYAPAKTFIAIEKGRMVGIVSVRTGSDKRAWIDRFYYKDISKNLKKAHMLLKKGLETFPVDYFYLEVEKENKHKDDVFFRNCEFVTTNENRIIYKRIIDVKSI